MAKNTNPSTTASDATSDTAAPEKRAKAAPWTPDATVASIREAVANGGDAAVVAALLPGGPATRSDGGPTTVGNRRNAVLAALAPVDPAAMAVVIDAIPLAAAVTPRSREVVPADHGANLAALAAITAAYVAIHGVDLSDVPGPVRSFAQAATKVDVTDPAAAGDLARAVIRGRTGAAGTRTDRSDGRDLSRLAGESFGFRGCDATVTVDGDALAVVVTRGRKAVGTFTSLSAAGRAAYTADTDGRTTQVDGWSAWRTSDGRTVDAVARGLVVSN